MPPTGRNPHDGGDLRSRTSGLYGLVGEAPRTGQDPATLDRDRQPCEARRMADPEKPGKNTTEFILTLIANALGAVALSGLVTDEPWVKAIGLASCVVTSALYTWQRTQLKIANANNGTPNTEVGRGDATTRDSQAGQSEFTMLFVLVIMSCAIFASTALVHGCSSVKTAAHDVAGSVVDCTKNATANTVHELRPLGDALLSNALADGKVDWGPVRDVAKGFATDVGRCVLADAVARALAPRKPDPNAPKLSPLEVNPDELRAGFRQLAGDLYGGASFKTEAGAL